MTLKDFRDYILRVSEMSYGEFSIQSEKHQAFCQKLNKIGARNMMTHPPEEYPDIDATVILTPKEEEYLRAEFYSLNLDLGNEAIN